MNLTTTMIMVSKRKLAAHRRFLRTIKSYKSIIPFDAANIHDAKYSPPTEEEDSEKEKIPHTEK